MKAMFAGRIEALEQLKAEARDGAPRGGRPRRVNNAPDFTLIQLLVVVAAIVLVVRIPAWAEDSAEPNSLAQALAAVRDSMAKSPAP